jgi:hypothetical protein
MWREELTVEIGRSAAAWNRGVLSLLNVVPLQHGRRPERLILLSIGVNFNRGAGFGGLFQATLRNCCVPA